MKILPGHFAEYSTKRKGLYPPRIVRPKSWHMQIDEREKKLECKECGKKLKQINWIHLKKHELTPDEYREKHGIPYSDGMSVASTKEKRRRLVNQRIKDGRVKLIKPTDPAFKGGYKKTTRKSPGLEKARKHHSKVMKNKYLHDEEFRKKTHEGLKKSWEARKGMCLVCDSGVKGEIDDLIKKHISDTKISNKYKNISRGAIQTHRVRCLGLKRTSRIQPNSKRKNGKCAICGKDFVYYKYDRTRYGVPNYERKYCGNKCKGLGMTIDTP